MTFKKSFSLSTVNFEPALYFLPGLAVARTHVDPGASSQLAAHIYFGCLCSPRPWELESL